MVTQASLGVMVSQIFFGVDNSPLVVNMQGNFRNPQDDLGYIPGVWLTAKQLSESLDPEGKPQTWIGYEKQDSRPRVLPAFYADPDGSPWSGVYKISRCRLQIVGAQAEQWAESVAHWNLRTTVQEQLTLLDATLLADGLGSVVASRYHQDGANTVFAYNVSFNLGWMDSINDEGKEYWQIGQIQGLVEVTP